MKTKLTLLLAFFYLSSYAQDAPLEPNLAINGTISSFSSTSSPSTRPATNAIDGIDNDANLWTSLNGFPQFIEIDLGADMNIQASKVSSYTNRIYKYQIEARESNGTYTTVVDQTHNGALLKTDYWSKKARYVKLTITGTITTATSASIREFYIYGRPLDEAGTISGMQEIIIGGNTTFSSTISGGAWSSSDPTIATVNATTGTITGVALGSAVITYTISGSGGSPDTKSTRVVAVKESILPINMTSFTASASSDFVALKWQTKSEANTSHFDLYRSIDGTNFDKVTVLKAAGNSKESLNYEVKDSFYPQGYPVVYYKLETIDLDGRVSYSKIIAVNLNFQNSSSRLYPNPAKDRITLTYTSSKHGFVNFQIFSANGELVISQKKQVLEGNSRFEFDISQLAHGTYFMKWEDRTEKFIKL